MVLFVTFLVVVTMVYSIKFSGPSVSTVIEQLKEESTKQNMKIDQLIMEKNQLKDEKDELEEKLANQMQSNNIIIEQLKEKLANQNNIIIEQLKEESTKQNMKIGQLIMEKNQLKDKKDELEEKLANQMQTEKEEVLNEKIEDLQKELLKFKESQKGIVDAAFHWLTSSFNSLKKQAEHTFYSIIWKKMWEYIQVLFWL